MSPNNRLAIALTALVLATTALGQNWSIGRFNIPEVSTAFGVAYGKGRFVAGVQGGGQGARIAWSTDGVAWQQSALLGASASLTYFAEAFYNPSGAGVYRSVDGTAWQQIYQIPPGTSVQRAATNGRGMMLDAGTFNGVLHYSPDMVTWGPATSLPFSGLPGAVASITAMAAGAGRYFVSYTVTGTTGFNGGYTASSVDGRSWALVAEFRNARAMAGGNGQFVALSGSFAYLTTNGTSFTGVRLPAELAGIGIPGTSIVFDPGTTSLVFAGGRFVALPSMHASIDGATWTVLAPFPKSPTAEITSIAYGNGRYLAVGRDFQANGGQGADVLATLSAAAPPLFTSQPAALTSAEGARATFSVTIENADIGTTYQWRRDGVTLAGATSPSYVVFPVTAASAGNYSVAVRNALGPSTSEPAALSVVPAAQAGRIVNLSVLASLDSSGSTLSAGYVVGGAGTIGSKALLLRAGGPSLARFGVGGPNPDPRLELFSGTVKDDENDNWGGTVVINVAVAQVGAFPFLSADSKDAAIYAPTMTRGDHTVRVTGNNSVPGTVIAEIYDATPAAEITATTPRLINVSVLKSLPGGGTISAGFVLGGATAKTVLIRAVGPALAALAVPSPLADPKLAVFRQGVAVAIASNDNWGGDAATQAAMSAVGAFALPGPTSKDAALVLTLAPGAYTAEVTADAVGGYALVEIYDVP